MTNASFHEKFRHELEIHLYDGNAVLEALSPAARRRTGPENVSDVLDALARVAKAKAEEVP